MTAPERPVTLPGLEGAAVAVTGGASGIGRGTVLLAARSGASVTAGDVNPETLDELADLARAEGLDVRCRRLDVRDPDAVTEFVAAADVDGRLRGVVNAAGIAVERPTLEVTDEFWDDVLRVNLTGTFLVARAAAERLVDRPGGGAIVNVAATSGSHGRARMVPYASSKGAMIGLTKALAQEWGPRGVRVNCVSPGAVDTPLAAAQISRRDVIAALPLPRMGQPQDLALAIGCFLTDLTPWVTGQTLNVNGGSIMYV
ncbi:SDR family NAD(P)-dependent oxidoreductase [Pseudonocardia sp. CA-107938]|uniref:SDR family NAD(P)-dependent oxidoreductase n=1 Tax=Pseudonocardia sp. CA-107938 TaxID=3240021 RepID=UPI003D8BCC49